MNKTFLKYYYHLTGIKEKNIKNILNEKNIKNNIICTIVDLILLKYSLNDRIISLKIDTEKWYGDEIKNIGRIPYNMINKNNPFMVEQKYKKYFATVFYNKKKISEKQVKKLLYQYWLCSHTIKDISKKCKLNNIFKIIGKKLGYFTPINGTNNFKKIFGLFINIGIKNTNLFFDLRCGFGQQIYVNNKNLLEKIYNYIFKLNKILSKLKPIFYVKNIELEPND